jgi:hypothetical protein
MVERLLVSAQIGAIDSQLLKYLHQANTDHNIDALIESIAVTLIDLAYMGDESSSNSEADKDHSPLQETVVNAAIAIFVQFINSDLLSSESQLQCIDLLISEVAKTATSPSRSEEDSKPLYHVVQLISQRFPVQFDLAIDRAISAIKDDAEGTSRSSNSTSSSSSSAAGKEELARFKSALADIFSSFGAYHVPEDDFCNGEKGKSGYASASTSIFIALENPSHSIRLEALERFVASTSTSTSAQADIGGGKDLPQDMALLADIVSKVLFHPDPYLILPHLIIA